MGQEKSAKRQRREGLGHRINRLVAWSVLLTMAGLGLFLIGFQIRQETSASQRQLEATAYVLASAAAEHLEANSPGEIMRVFRSVNRLPDILYAAAVDAQGHVVASMGTAAMLEGDLITEEPTVFNMLRQGKMPVNVAVIRGGLKVGRIVLIGDVSSIRRHVLWTMLATLLAALGSVMIAMLIAKPFQSRIVKPIVKLTALMQSVRETRNFQVAEIADAQGETQQLLESFNGMISDIKRRDLSLQKLAYFDPLTGLPNRVHFQKLLEEFLKTDKNAHAAVYLLDIDNFHAINDAMGHSIGDALLMDVAARLHAATEHSEAVVSRLGGDEFAIMIPALASINNATDALAPYLASFFKPVQILGHELHITLSTGVVLLPEHGQDVSDIQRHLDLAMFEAKNEGVGRVALFKPELAKAIKEESDIAKGLRQALLNGGLQPHFQPVVDLATGKVAGFEALSRWIDPVLGFVSPAKFIPVAEKSGLITALGHWILAESCRQGKAWLDAGKPERFVAVNISAAQMMQVGFVASVETVLAESGFPARLLCLELTESLFIGKSMANVQKMLSSLSRLGVQTALDDFGTGYSSLAYLEQLHFDKLKIDRAFVTNNHLGGKKAELLGGIISLAHSLGMSVVAEGAETADEMQSLTAMKADFVQGYVYCKPLAALEAAAKADAIDQAVHENTGGPARTRTWNQTVMSRQL